MTRAWVMAGLLALSTAARAAPSAAEAERILGGFERAPTAEDVRRLGPGADQALIAVAQDGRVSRVRRARAIAALRFAPSVSAHAFLRAVLDEKGRAVEGADVFDVASALTALTPYGGAELTIALGYLAHGSADVRQSAAAAIGLHGDPVGAAPLRARLTVERDPGVRLVLQRSLAQLEAAR